MKQNKKVLPCFCLITRVDTWAVMLGWAVKGPPKASGVSECGPTTLKFRRPN